MTVDELYMSRCLELAALGLGNVQPNPMVGAVIVAHDNIIGEGWHRKYGEPHAEINAFRTVEKKELLPMATLYVNLEPCSHFGKTPPCADAIIANEIPRVVIGNVDPNTKVDGKGVAKLQQAGIEVVTGVLDEECRNLNRRFFTYHQKKRPYVILKWAQTADGYMDVERSEDGSAPPYWITNQELKTLTHKWRSEEDAIVVGFNTWKNDRPRLTTRLFPGKDPQAFIAAQGAGEITPEPPFVFLSDQPADMLEELYEKKIQSVIVEGGRKVLDRFLEHGLWDEIRILVGDQQWGKGLPAPLLQHEIDQELTIRNHKIRYVRRHV
ncbi:bifunctional diaminohydroxyphosphoribosylaminopyrimidine deaminase/5-amino-6-(5-phosphoribosylamino)uracil reductase RibD [Bacteroidales bacterium OttesenSCG-928-B11]|nr:bifunctional diaminohydroxyphosphoribosylaminopyrimidine deaminase/5-amino-6-(5-phosphoribosylamino)uracil reductase RibD [Bacteroidales bacterium OttesenSCG-928-E04]MDL2308799.1 bifunctional diaminohydroxyphosphoribosylaminopyrimidine deaminase/5-amino-6-(5-phosphoribosylamino)uracil reductase RibD [Bacteroidales bacterium OttesenSCG-928-C03]MDL2312077.1 bifunctional diaminohydroxyphosphoribosylaminopyrimidine deaminase/5-amino-6-(5-phosphoribosylamino)uracil reductase RibD [Bacteroidales bac